MFSFLACPRAADCCLGFRCLGVSRCFKEAFSTAYRECDQLRFQNHFAPEPPASSRHKCRSWGPHGNFFVHEVKRATVVNELNRVRQSRNTARQHLHETPVFMRVLQNPCRSKQCGLRVGKVNEIQVISTVFLGFFAIFTYFGRKLPVFALMAAPNPRQMRLKTPRRVRLTAIRKAPSSSASVPPQLACSAHPPPAPPA